MNLDRNRIFPIASIGLMLLSLLMLVTGVETIRFKAPLRLAEKSALNHPALYLGEIAIINQLMIIIMILVWLMVVIAILHPQIRARVLQRLAQYILLVAMLVGAALIWSWLAGNSGDDELPVAPPTASQLSFTFVNIPSYEDDGAYSAPQALPPLLGYLLSLAILLSVIGAGWYVWLRQRQPGLEDLAETARASILELEAGGELQDVIMRCYAQMLDVLTQQRGIRRQLAMTPAEFATWLTKAGLPERPVRRLTLLFERVRYGGLASGQAEAMEAIDCLNAVARACERQPA